MANVGAKPEVQIYVDTSGEDYTGLWPQTCVGPKNANVSQEIWIEPIRYVVEFEEKDLRKVKNTTSEQFKKLQSDFQWIGDALSMNILLFVGHIESCDLYVEDILKKVRRNERLFSNNLPVLFLIIACHGDHLAYDNNMTKSFWGPNKIYSFGFKNLVHIYNGDIYSCEQPHLKIPDMACDYDGSKEDKEKLFNNAGQWNQSKYNSKNDPNKLAQCCEAKFSRFSHIFVDYLNKRKCGKFTKETLLKKFQSVLYAKRSLPGVANLSKEDSTLTNEDAILCAPEGNCQIENPFSLTNVSIYNERRIFVKKYEEILKGVSPFALAKIKNENATNLSDPVDGKLLVETLNRLGKDREAVVNYFYPGYGNLLQMICYYADAYYNHDILIRELIRYTNDLKLLDNFGNTALTNFVLNGTFSKKFDQQTYDILMAFFKKDPKVFVEKTGESIVPLLEAVSQKNELIIYFYLRHFPDIDLKNQGILRALAEGDPKTYFDGPRLFEGTNFLITPGLRNTFFEKIEAIDKKDYSLTENLTEILLAYGADPMEKQHYGIGPEEAFFPELDKDNYVNLLISKPLPVSEKIMALLFLFRKYSYSNYLANQLSFFEYVVEGKEQFVNYNSNRNLYSGRYNRYGGAKPKLHAKQRGGAFAHPEMIEPLKAELKTVIEDLKAKSADINQIQHFEFFYDHVEQLFYHAFNTFLFCDSIQTLNATDTEQYINNIEKASKEYVHKFLEKYEAPQAVKDTFAVLDTFLKGAYTSKMPKNFKGQVRQESLTIMKNTSKAPIDKVKALKALLDDVVGRTILSAVTEEQEKGRITNENARNFVMNSSNIMYREHTIVQKKMENITELLRRITNTSAHPVAPLQGGRRIRSTRKRKPKGSAKKQTQRHR